LNKWEYKNGKKIIEKEIEIIDNERNEYCTYMNMMETDSLVERSDNSTFYYRYDETRI